MVDIERQNSLKSNPFVSTTSHIVTDGGETLTKAPEGAVIGFFVGIAVGLFFGLLVISGIFEGLSLDSLSVGEKISIVVGSMLGGAAVGALAGVLVGIGTPKFNPHPQQGRFRSWRTILNRNQDRTRKVFIPEDPRPDVKPTTH